MGTALVFSFGHPLFFKNIFHPLTAASGVFISVSGILGSEVVVWGQGGKKVMKKGSRGGVAGIRRGIPGQFEICHLGCNTEHFCKMICSHGGLRQCEKGSPRNQNFTKKKKKRHAHSADMMRRVRAGATRPPMA